MPRKRPVGSNPTPSAFGPPKRTYGVTKSARRFAKATFGPPKRTYDVTKSARRFAKATFAKFMYYVYSLKCKDGFYIGCTDNLENRLERHQKGRIPATENRQPLELDFYFAINNKYKSYEFEKYLKSGSGRAFTNKHFI